MNLACGINFRYRPLMVVPTNDTCTEIEALFYFRDIVNGLKYRIYFSKSSRTKNSAFRLKT